jgi:hypothetical protein
VIEHAKKKIRPRHSRRISLKFPFFSQAFLRSPRARSKVIKRTRILTLCVFAKRFSACRVPTWLLTKTQFGTAISGDQSSCDLKGSRGGWEDVSGTLCQEGTQSAMLCER